MGLFTEMGVKNNRRRDCSVTPAPYYVELSDDLLMVMLDLIVLPVFTLSRNSKGIRADGPYTPSVLAMRCRCMAYGLFFDLPWILAG